MNVINLLKAITKAEMDEQKNNANDAGENRKTLSRPKCLHSDLAVLHSHALFML